MTDFVINPVVGQVTTDGQFQWTGYGWARYQPRSGTPLFTVAAVADTVPYFTGPFSAASTAFAALGRSLVGGATPADMRGTLGFAGPVGYGGAAGPTRMTVYGNTIGAAQFVYGTSDAPLPPDLTYGYGGLGSTLYTNGDMTTAAGTVAIYGRSYRNSGKNGIAYGGLFEAFNGGTWTADDINGGAIGLLAGATTSRGGAIFAFAANLSVTTITGSLARIAELDSFCAVDVASKYGVIIVSTQIDLGNATDSYTLHSGRSVNDSAGLQIRNTLGGVGWFSGIALVSLQGATGQPVKPAGSLFLADMGTVARGLDWYKMAFSDHAIGLGNTQKISWRNAADAAFISGITVDSSDRVSLYGGQLTVTSAGLLSLGGSVFAVSSAGFNFLYDGVGLGAIALGPDATNYYRQTNHQFGNIGGGTVYMTIGAGGVTAITSASATAFTVGRLGAATPAFTVDASTGSQVAGFKIVGAATGGTVALVVTDSGSNANLTINAKGTGTIGIGSVSTGVVTITPALNAVSTISLNGHLFAANSSNYNTLYDGSANSAILLGGVDPTNYYRNTSHVIGNIGGATVYATIDATGISTLVAMTAYSGTAIPAGGTAGKGVKFSSTANFGVFFGSGAPTLSAAKGSLYLRSDGSGTGDRAYINTDGGTTWTALTTAA